MNGTIDVVTALEKWRKDRQMDKQTFDHYNQAGRLFEEVSEFILKEPIDACCDLQVFAINAMSTFNQPINLIDVRQLGDQKVLPSIFDIADKVNLIGRGMSTSAMFNQLMDIVTMSAQIVEHKGYNNYDCMMEAIKEISSRKQDPEQAKQWAITGPVGKWNKDKNQPENTLYRANYAKCLKTASADGNIDTTNVFESADDILEGL